MYKTKEYSVSKMSFLKQTVKQLKAKGFTENRIKEIAAEIKDAKKLAILFPIQKEEAKKETPKKFKRTNDK